MGIASWYGEYFQGKPTASGEPYDMHDFTAAHPSIPLGTFIKVTNLRNGKAVVLRVNDRGPVVAGRIIDVSYNAARALGFKERGLQRVRVDLYQPTNRPGKQRGAAATGSQTQLKRDTLGNGRRLTLVEDIVENMDPRQRLIVALDVPTAAAARKIVAAVGDSALTYKVGMQLYTAEGPVHCP